MATEVSSAGAAQPHQGEVAAAALAGLLHDIGAFWYRTGEHVPPEVVSAGRSSTPVTIHAHWSAAFVARHVLVGCQDEVVTAVRDHHQPQDRLGNLVALAALLAAGGVRPSPDGGSVQLQSVLAALHCAEETGDASEATATPDRTRRFYVPLHPLAPNRAALFSTNVRLPAREAAAAYTRLWHGLLEEHALIPMTNDLAYADSLWWLLRKYTWCTPSIAAGQGRDTSLFDHLRLTAALAVGLVLNGTSDDEITRLLAALTVDRAEETPQPPPTGDLPTFTLVALQVSERGWPAGQPHNTSVDIARATSFSRTLLRRGVVAWLRERWSLPQTNVLFEGGGTAYLLAPAHVSADVDGAQTELAQRLWQEGRWRGQVTLAAQPLTVADLCPRAVDSRVRGNDTEEQGRDDPEERTGHLGTIWRDVGETLAWRSSRLGAVVETEHLAAELFTAQGRGGNAPTCRLCSTELAPSDRGAGSEETCDRCRSLRELGRLLRNPGFLVLSHSQPSVDLPSPAPSPGLVAPPPPDTEPVVVAVPDAPAPADTEQPGETGWQAALGALGLRVALLPATDAPPDHQAERLLHALPPRGLATVLRLNDIAGGWAELQQLARTDRPLIIGWEVLTDGHALPGGRVDLRSLGRRARGVRTAAFLRSDLDDVLTHLAAGLGRTALPGRVLTVSALLQVFTELWVPAVLSGAGVSDSVAERRRSRVCGIMASSGGLGLVGAWNTVVELAQQLARDLVQYGCRNAALHLSAGIVTAQPRMSVLMGDEAALSALGQAKGRRPPAFADASAQAKDGICFLGQTLGWPAFNVAARYRRTLMQRGAGSGAAFVPALLTAFTQLRAAATDWPVGGEPAGSNGAGEQSDFPQQGRLPIGTWTWYAAQEFATAARELPADEARRMLVLAELLRNPQEVGLPALMVATAWAALLSGTDARLQEVSW
jgi:CRISPR-associated protein Csm1